MNNNTQNYDFENVIEDIIDFAEVLSEGIEPQTIALEGDDGDIIELELMFSFKINDSMYAICVNDEDELIVLRRDQIHRTGNFIFVESEVELTEVRDALRDLTE